MNDIKPLTLEETALKEEMKSRCLIKGQYVDEKAEDKFKMLCHLEDFEIQYWELKHILDELEKYLEEFDKSLCKTMVRDNSEFYHFQRGELVFLRNTKLKIKELRGRENEPNKSTI